MHGRLAENLRRVHGRIAEACGRCGRDPESVRLVAVTKSGSMEVVREMLALGVRDLGENRAPELVRRATAIREMPGCDRKAAGNLRWHMIGHLQRNKVRQLLPWVSVVHSVDTLRLAEDIHAESLRLNCVTPVLVEVNAADEPDKHGVAVAATTHFVEQICTLPNMAVCGLMAMAPLTQDKERIRRVFMRVRELFEEVVDEKLAGRGFVELSMGMSNDFEVAIESGATLVRLGSVLMEGVAVPPAPASAEG